MHRRSVIALLIVCLAGGVVSLAAAQSDKAPTAFAAQTTTTPEDIGQDLGDDGQTGDQGAGTPGNQTLPFTGWRGRDAVFLGMILLVSGLWLRASTVRSRT